MNLTYAPAVAWMMSLAMFGALCGDAGCSGESKGAGPDPGADLTGVWQGTWRSNSGANGNISANFSQTAAGQISGTANVSGSLCTLGKADASGTMSGSSATLTLTSPVNARVTLTASVSGNQLSGSYDSEKAGLCPHDTGSVTLKR